MRCVDMILQTELTLHVFVAPIISLDFFRLLFMANGGETQTVCGLNLQKAQRGPDNDDTDLPLITARDVNACNGIIHVIDEVMLPQPVARSESEPPPSPSLPASSSATGNENESGGIVDVVGELMYGP